MEGFDNKTEHTDNFLAEMKQKELEDKINYIYAHIKAEKRNAIIKILFKFALLATFIYGIFFYLPQLPQEVKDEYAKTISSAVTQKVSDVVTPVVQDVSQSIVKDMQTQSQDPKVIENATLNMSSGTVSQIVKDEETQKKLNEMIQKRKEEILKQRQQQSHSGTAN